jgi:hypothetical protein
MYRKTLAVICLFASLDAYADGPQYQVFPQLKSLRVSYHVETKTKLTTIYATNHESFPVICDAAMNTNKQDKSKGRETVLEPSQTKAFSFPQRAAVTSVRLFLMCEASEDPIAKKPAKSEDNQKTEDKTEKAAPVIVEEDLNKI